MAKNIYLGFAHFSFTSPSDLTVLYESEDCSGQPYVRGGAEGIEGVRANSMLETVPIIASIDPINDPANETLWEADDSEEPIVREIRSSWSNTASRPVAGSDLPAPPKCLTQNFGQPVPLLPVIPVFDLSSKFTPPYSLRLQ